mmetsp:Transcript_14292/g.23358  ORF Transcript_14292/g.23358 Transcript_14292/m.23358 type:complete len:225 (+) Transcript_14292:869-1543(+)
MLLQHAMTRSYEFGPQILSDLRQRRRGKSIRNLCKKLSFMPHRKALLPRQCLTQRTSQRCPAPSGKRMARSSALKKATSFGLSLGMLGPEFGTRLAKSRVAQNRRNTIPATSSSKQESTISYGMWNSELTEKLCYLTIGARTRCLLPKPSAREKVLEKTTSTRSGSSSSKILEAEQCKQDRRLRRLQQHPRRRPRNCRLHRRCSRWRHLCNSRMSSTSHYTRRS